MIGTPVVVSKCGDFLLDICSVERSSSRGLRESVVIGLLRVSNFSAHRHRRKLKFTDNLLIALTKNGIDADFRNLPRGNFCSILKIFVILKLL